MSNSPVPTAVQTRPNFCHALDREVVPILEESHAYWNEILSDKIDVEGNNLTHQVVIFEGPLNLTCLQKSLDSLALRHSIITAQVADSVGGPAFYTGRTRHLVVRREDVSSVTTEGRTEISRTLASKLVWEPFGRDNAPLFRLFVIKLSDTQHIVGFVLHHFIGDASAVEILTNDLFTGYFACESGLPSHLPPTALSYVDYVAGMNEWIRSRAATTYAQYWTGQLLGAPAVHLSVAHRVATNEVGEIGRESFRFEESLIEQLQLVAKSKSRSLFAVLLAAQMAALSHLTNTADIVIYTTTSCRSDPRLRVIVGRFLNNIPLRCKVSMHATFDNLLSDAWKTTVEGLARNIYPCELVVSSIPEAGTSRIFPFFNFRVISAAPSEPNSRIKGFQIGPPPPTITSVDRRPNHCVEALYDGREVYGHVKFPTLKYERNAVRDFVSAFRRVLDRSAQDPSQKIASLLAE